MGQVKAKEVRFTDRELEELFRGQDICGHLVALAEMKKPRGWLPAVALRLCDAGFTIIPNWITGTGKRIYVSRGFVVFMSGRISGCYFYKGMSLHNYLADSGWTAMDVPELMSGPDCSAWVLGWKVVYGVTRVFTISESPYMVHADGKLYPLFEKLS